jgi:hypothetical protein
MILASYTREVARNKQQFDRHQDAVHRIAKLPFKREMMQIPGSQLQ